MKPSFIKYILAQAFSIRESQDGATSCTNKEQQSNHVSMLTGFAKTMLHTHTGIHLPPGRSWLRSVCSNIAMGIPTFLERPATSTFFPTVSIPAYTHSSKVKKKGDYRLTGCKVKLCQKEHRGTTDQIIYKPQKY